MPPKTTDQIRQAYLDFFKSKGHAVIPGAPLVPENDPTVLFTTAGMHPLVPYLLGEPHPAGKRLVDVQRCVRTQDIDEVGDQSHLTMFEMLGNWSLGDPSAPDGIGAGYFKKEAIAFSFEFLTKVLELPLSKLAVTCFAGDQDAPRDTESAAVWMSLGITENRIGFLPKKNNWWGPAGQTGPCGPDTEMFFWVGKSPEPPAGSNPATDETNWMEIWNDVFMQYNKISGGSESSGSGAAGETHTYVPLKQMNVDTGMGLERVAAVMQGVYSVYDTDRMLPIVEKIATLAPEGFALDVPIAEVIRHQRIITDHLKAATFMIADGVQPGNVDQGYVLRRVIRRAIRSGIRIGIEGKGAFTPAIGLEVINQYSGAYPHLQTKAQEIQDALAREEMQFAKTLQEGLKQFARTIESVQNNIIDGLSAFHLYDTYGFPLELTKEMATESGLTVDEAGFAKSFEEHQAKSRAGAEKKFAGGLADHSAETTKLHTATHLLNAALKKVLGADINQKGSNITAERLRFDFNYADKMTPEQIAETERLVNEAINAKLPVSYHLTTVEGAKAEGAVGVFDDRYGSEVKVYVMGTPDNVFSKEICGGPHVANTGMLGSFKIQKEESSSAGVRRIKAVVSGGPAEIEVAGLAA
jgi:alanyl-tRNA synthetase